MANDDDDEHSKELKNPRTRKRKSSGGVVVRGRGVDGKQKIILNEALFKLSIKSKGGSVKKRGVMLETQMKACKNHPPNMNCRVETFGKMVANFGDLEKKWVKEMGFEGLMWLSGRGLPRNLCYWLMTMLDHIRKVLMLPGTEEYPISKNQVHWVLGVPCGPKAVPKRLKNSQLIADVDAIHNKYGEFIQNKHKILPLGNVRKRFDNPWSSDDEYDFKVAFLIVVLGDLLCPTTCGRLSSDLFPALSVAMDCGSYDWGELVVDTLMQRGKNFARKFYKDGYCKGCGGCTYFLAILYLDRLNRSPLKWEAFPRVRVWTTKLVNEARNDDRHGGYGDYGKLQCVDVAYGEQHPLSARDTMGLNSASQSMAFEVAKIVLNEIWIEARCRRETSVTPLYDSDESVVKKPTTKRRRTGPIDGIYFRRGDNVRKNVDKLIESNCHYSSSSYESVTESEVEGEIEGEIFEESEESKDKDWHPSDSNNEGNTSSIQDNDIISLKVENLEKIDNVLLLESDSKDEDWDPNICFDEDDKDDDDVRLMMRMMFVTSLEHIQKDDDGNDGDSLMDDNLEDDDVGVVYNSNDGELEENIRHNLQGEVEEKENEDGEENEDNNIVENESKVDGEEIDETNGKNLDGNKGQRLSYISDGDGENLSNNELDVVVNKVGLTEFTCVDFDGKRCKYLYNDLNAEQSQTSPIHQCSITTAPPLVVNKSRKKRGKKPSMKLKDKEFYTQIIPRTNQHMRKKIVNFVTSVGGARTRRKSGSTIMLQCGDQYASVQNCLSVLVSSLGGVDDNYVRAAAALYTRMWKHKFKDSSLRIMMDPLVGIRLLQEKEDDPADWITTYRVVKGCARAFVGTSSCRVYVVFIPMLQSGHWWCAAYCVNSEEIWVMDSASRGPLEEHSSTIDKLNVVVDMFLFSFDHGWVRDQLHKWPRKVVKVERQEDGYSCGVYMLGATKNCAERYQEEYVLPCPLVEEREWLLTDDLMSDFNEVKGNVKDMVGGVTTSE